MNRAFIRLITASILLAALAGCSGITYYAQSLGGHLRIISARQPIDEIIDDPSKPKELRARLASASEIRRFASDQLALPDNDSYRSYVDTHRDYVTWAVFAAPELSLEAQIWCFPVYGCVPYRGYFSEERATGFAAEMQQQGLDTYVGGITAYSTLGRSSDPLLNTMFRFDETYLAGLVFHELAHQEVYVADDTAFNEAFATVVETTGVAKWLNAKGDVAALRQYEAGRQREADFLALVSEARSELRELYALPGSREQKLANKAATIEALRERYRQVRDTRWAGYGGYDSWFDGPINNAKFAATAFYNDLVPVFERLFALCSNDYPRFYQAVRAIGTMDRVRRDRALKAADGCG